MTGQPQRIGEWHHHFPVGVLLQMGAKTTLPNAGDQGTTDFDANNVSGLTAHITNVYAGLAENNLRYALFYGGSPYFHEVQQALLNVLETNQFRGNVWAAFQVMGQRTSTGGTGLNAEFTSNTGVANNRSVCDPLAQTVVTDMSDHPSLLFYVGNDDTSSSADAANAAKNNTLVMSLQALDPHGRAATPMWRDRGYSSLGVNCRLIISYEYPCGRYSGGTDTAEGDFHRSTFASITGTSNPDWVDVIRHRTALLPAEARHMWCLQVHESHSGSASSQLRLPTDKELRTQFWIAVAEGATGVFWFPYTNYDIPGTGSLNQPMLAGRRSALAVARELSDRLKPEIRRRLLGCTAAGAATAFTASGGGTSGLPVDYPNAHVGELTHSDGLKYVVVVNRNTAAASVTISHPTLAGYLVSQENGTRYKVGTDAIPLAALDGTILLHEPSYGRSGRRGVPRWDVNHTLGVEAWWALHWANPASVNYVSSSNLPLHTNTVNVAVGANLQAIIDAAPAYTTFRLAANFTYPEIQLLERSHLHFTSANPALPAKIARVKIWGSRYAQQYNSQGTDYGFVGQLYSNTSDASLTAGGSKSIRAIARKQFFRTPARDIIFDQITFDATISDATHPVQPVVYYKLWDLGPGSVQTDHWYEGAPVSMRCVQDIVVQRCTIQGYKWGSDNADSTSSVTFAATGTFPQENNIGPVSHPGLIWGNAGTRNIVVRDNTFTLSTNALGTGSPSCCFFDGLQGGAFYNNIVSGKQNQDTANLLINDDYTADMRVPGYVDPSDKRMGRFFVMASNTLTTSGSPTIISFSGEKLLVRGNTLNGNPTGTTPTAVILSSKACRLASTQGVFYECGGCVIDGNIVTANAITTFVQYNGLNGYTPGLTYTSPVRSRLYGATITNNTCLKQNGTATTITNWSKEDGPSLAASPPALIDSAPTIFGNNVNDTTGVGI